MNKLLLGLLLSVLAVTVSYSQIFYNHNYDFLNPAHVGLNEKANISTEVFSYRSEYRDINFIDLDLNIPIKKMYSGIGAFYSYKPFYSNEVIRYGLKYSFTYPFSKDFIASIGVNISGNQYDIHANWSGYPATAFITLISSDIGFWLKYKKFQVGLTNNNINNPSKEFKLLIYTYVQTLESNMALLLSYEFELGKKVNLKNHLYIDHLNEYSKYERSVLNNIITINKTYLVGITTDKYRDFDEYIISPNLGVNLSDKFKFILTFDAFDNIESKYHSKKYLGILTYTF